MWTARRTATPLLPIFMMMNSRSPRHQSVLLLVTCGQPPIRRGEEKLSRGCSSTGREGDAQLIPTLWNWIFQQMGHIPLASTLKML